MTTLCRPNGISLILNSPYSVVIPPVIIVLLRLLIIDTEAYAIGEPEAESITVP